MITFNWLIIVFTSGFLFEDVVLPGCRAGQWVVALGLCTTCTGGVGIALMRLVYIKYKHWMEPLGEDCTAAIIGCATKLLALTMTFQACFVFVC